MFKIPQQAWGRIDAAINAARRERNAGVPAQFHEHVSEYAVMRDVQSGRVVVTAVRFGNAEVRMRSGAGEVWKRFA